MPSPGDDDATDTDGYRSSPDEKTTSNSPGEEVENEANYPPRDQNRAEISSDEERPMDATQPARPSRKRSGGEDRPAGQWPEQETPERERGGMDSQREKDPLREEWRNGPPRTTPSTEESGDDSPGEWRLFVYDVVSSVLAVAIIGAYLFAVSGVWPPLVAVESGSMEPNMQVNDLVFVMEEERFPGAGAHQSGVVTARAGEEVEYRQFNGYGDVIVYQPNGNEQTTPIIHRAMFWVEGGENWCRQANPSYLGGMDPSSDRCIADHGGFITKGDNNARYDQAQRLSGPVKPEWVVGTAQVRVPGLGWIRLRSAG